MKEIIGIDIGGTSMKCGLVANSKLEQLNTTTTDPKKDKDYMLNNLYLSIDQVFTKNTTAIGIGIPGFIDSKKGIIYDSVNIESWKNLNLKKVIEDRFKVPVFIDNDANCFVQGSRTYGISKSCQNVVGLTLGTGLGAGVIINGQLCNGLNNCAGEFGQIAYRDNNFEDYCSGKFFQLRYNSKGEDIYKLANTGDENSIKIWEEFGEHLAELIQLISYCLAPEIIVFGGSVSNGFPLYINRLRDKLETFRFQQPFKNLKILKENNPDIAILGAASLCFS
jgi:glucokinase